MADWAAVGNFAWESVTGFCTIPAVVSVAPVGVPSDWVTELASVPLPNTICWVKTKLFALVQFPAPAATQLGCEVVPTYIICVTVTSPLPVLLVLLLELPVKELPIWRFNPWARRCAMVCMA